MMIKNIKTWLQVAVLASTGFACALPALPAPELTSSAVQQSLATTPELIPAQQAAAQQLMQETVAVGRSGRSVIAHATAYNSLGGQTDPTPNITATGSRTRPGVVALSRDLLRIFPYGSRIQLEDLSGRRNFSGQVFLVEDTTSARLSGTIDIWMPSYRQAIAFGSHTVRITALR